MILRYTTKKDAIDADFTIYIGSGGLAGQSIIKIDFNDLCAEVFNASAWLDGRFAVRFTDNLKHISIDPKGQQGNAHIEYIINRVNKEICSAYIEWLAERELIGVNRRDK